MEQFKQGPWVWGQIQKKLKQSTPEVQASDKRFLFLLRGNLGLGKTAFVKSFLQDRGLDSQQVQSPTFLKMLEYEIPEWGVGIHLDCYQLESVKALEKLGLEERIMESDVKIVFVEWPDQFLEYVKSHSPLLKNFLDSFVKVEIVWKDLGVFSVQIH